MTTTAGEPRTGIVADFDAHRGWGHLAGDDGRLYGFHCAAISDGTRTIEVGRAVQFRVLAKLGRLEAAAVTPV